MARHLQDLFRTFDTDNSGMIELREFVAALGRLNFVGVERDMEGLFYRYDEDLSGSLDYAEFTRNLFGLNDVAGGSAGRSVVERVKQKIIARGGANGVRGITLILRRWDRDGGFTLDRNEVWEGLCQYGIRLDREANGDLDKLMRYFDRDGSGRISIEEFHRGLRGRMAYRRRLLVREAFTRLDRTGDGIVTLRDLQGVYDPSMHPDVRSGKITPDDAVREMMDVFEGSAGNRDGTITWAEFIDYYKDLSSGIDHDDYFELMIRNAWHISGGEGWAANSSCRRVLVVHTDDSEEVVEIRDDLGLRGSDMAGIMERLRKQGVRNIKKVSLTA